MLPPLAAIGEVVHADVAGLYVADRDLLRPDLDKPFVPLVSIAEANADQVTCRPATQVPQAVVVAGVGYVLDQRGVPMPSLRQGVRGP